MPVLSLVRTESPRYTVLVFRKNFFEPIYEQGTEEPDAVVAWACRQYPLTRVILRDTYSGSGEVVRDWESNASHAQRIAKAFAAWADWDGGEPEFQVRLASETRWQVWSPIGGGWAAFEVHESKGLIEFVEGDSSPNAVIVLGVGGHA